ncbi:DNA-directed RNA polymerase I subunit RPA2 [Culex quinquefasciatus]|uniref:DNA-directed RNA polymerase I subunit RPA2 n=1 Tax=Culex quinquefasciatus TaxID=7176 RepID=UPI0018E35B06|nr:DNA-directed RNA polymerase I subunit RPA2 [Culex quinquefasciatus]
MKDLPVLTNLKPQFREIPKEQNKVLANLGAPHIESFDYVLREGLADVIRQLDPVEFELPNKDRVRLRIGDCSIARPVVPLSQLNVREKRVFPSECRQKNETYAGMCTITVDWEVNGQPKPAITRDIGALPVMLRSRACNLGGMSPAELVERGEHEDEWGGHFVVRGMEKLIRMLIMTRRNYPIVLSRNSWRDRGKEFSSTGIMIRCVRTDQTSTNNVLHYLVNGTAKLMFSIRRSLTFIPIMMLLKALSDYTDNEIYKRLIVGYEEDQYYKHCIQNMLRELHEEGIHNQVECKDYMGKVFRSKLYYLPAWYTDAQRTDHLLKTCVLIHLESDLDKFNLLVFMMQKLFTAAQGRCKLESVDSTMMQELLLGGHLYQKLLREHFLTFLNGMKYNMLKLCSDADAHLGQNEAVMACKNASNFDRAFSNFFATGNLQKASEMGLMQDSGLVIIAENINRMRYMSHFRAIHRGSFFVTMRTTEARQLLPDAWGFICPVHTPDGTPCGLLNHLTTNCRVSNSPEPSKVRNIEKYLIQYGMTPANSVALSGGGVGEGYTVMVEGRIVGRIPKAVVGQAVQQLRMLKIEGKEIPEATEIVFIPSKEGGQYPGLYIFVGAARMMRPVINLDANKVELIGTFEQVYMDICITAKEAYPKVTTHKELSKTSFLSNLAMLIPMPDCNQSPRNMYQCQMGKQTMGTPCHNWQLQCIAKFYRLQTPATPLFRPVHHDNIDLDNYAMGTNAIVAVISYTGYDMEDAMIINKSAFERGFAHGTVYKNELIELKGDSFFARDPRDERLKQFLDNDGLPYRSALLQHRNPMYCYFDTNDHTYHVVKFDHHEDGIVDNIKLCGTTSASAPKKAVITYRIVRNPNVGDKFASRAGQKGICSQKWPAVDLPFTESGMIPDIIFNPHGFPSRMTIAMMIETMAGKTGACHGLVHDATPFRYTEENTAIDYFGRLLESSGYNYFGTERMYSGVDGREMKADIFFGVVHYQRLRHMVSDKWQVRSTGPLDQLTHQPNKGRSRGGGVRFGEMERDALIAHGASFLLQDRLFHGSDKITTLVCRSCGTLIGPISSITKKVATNATETERTPATCRLCRSDQGIGHVEIPYIFKFLVSQLTAMNINVKLDLALPKV